MDKEQNPDNTNKIKQKEIGKVILLSILWVVLLALSFLTFYAIPAVIFITWMIIAWMVKSFKEERDKGSGYDRDF
ncbi:MAG: hypothetical protein J7K66_01235 [Anaerolineaceae bacterium]|nr:hypothetical protein [Anaerolineaceae bacterium]